jgi:carbonic anhydrase
VGRESSKCLEQKGPEAITFSGDHGPAYWGEVNEDWAACSEDMRQSPIDLRKFRKDSSLEDLELDIRRSTTHIMNTGYQLRLEYEEGSTLTLDGSVYMLLQLHFHTLSEHTFKGKHMPMEMHVVFVNIDDPSDLAVIGQFYEISDDDEENEFLAQFQDHLPTKSGEENDYQSADLIDLAEGLEDTDRYFTYSGSLTTPACAPIVTWFVLREKAEMSAAQFQTFRDIMGNNFRPIQDRNGRKIRKH